MLWKDLQAQGEADLYERLSAEPEVKRAIAQADKDDKQTSARRQLLATAVRLTREMSPTVAQIMDACRAKLSLDSPIETYVYPAPVFNAAAVKPERGRLFVLLSSSLLEAFDEHELAFVVGHELGHHVFEHHRLPVQAIVRGGDRLAPGLVLRLFSWQRYCEISCDRVGLYCCGSIDPAARCLFRLASGLRSSVVQIRVEAFLSQLGELREEGERLRKADGPAQGEWFSTHPFSPLRLRAAQLFAESELMRSGGISREHLEAQVQELLGLMSPNYLQEKSETAEAMRRLLFAAGAGLAAASGRISKKTLEALEELLGAGSVPSELKPEVIREDLPNRIAQFKELVPPLRRAQVIRDLCLLARADGKISDPELSLIEEIARAVEVDELNLCECCDDP